MVTNFKNEVNLSECTEAGRIFLYDGEPVVLNYILRMIWNEEELPEIRLCNDKDNFNQVLDNVVQSMSEDVQNGVNKEKYEMNGLKTTIVNVDITKSEIEQVDKYNYKLSDR